MNIRTAVLRGLSPSTEYYYRCGSDASGWSAEHHVTSGVSTLKPFTLAAYGDMGHTERVDNYDL